MSECTKVVSSTRRAIICALCILLIPIGGHAYNQSFVLEREYGVYRHKYVLKALALQYKFAESKRVKNPKNINVRTKELTTKDELRAFANLIELNWQYLEKQYVGKDKRYKEGERMSVKIMDGWYPRVKGKPVSPTNFGRHVIDELGTRLKLDPYIDLLIINDQEEKRR